MLRRAVPFLLATSAALLAVVGFAAPYVIEHSSMTPAVQPGELVLVDAALPRVLGFHRGEIVVFQPPTPDYSGPPFIKRVVGLPGETVSIHGGAVYVDGLRLDEPYVPSGVPTDMDVAAASWRVPAGTLFVLGDNRVDSWDSRSYGPVPVTAIVGEAWLGIGPTLSLGMLEPVPPALRR